MLRLFLLRHAEADSPSRVDDFDRVLTRHGREETAFIANYMVIENYKPDLVFVSAAKRTRETFDILNSIVGGFKFEIREQLYNASFGKMLGAARNTDTAIKSLMIIGHNPAIAELGMALIDQAKSNPAAMNHLSQGYPPAGLAVFNLKIDSWANIEMGQGNLRQFITPKVLGGVDEG